MIKGRIMRYVLYITKLLKLISGISLMGMMILTCADVVGGFFGYPVLGAEELVSLWASMLLAFALPTAHLAGVNVGVDLLYNIFPQRLQKLADVFNSVVSCLLFLLIAWRCWLYALALQQSGEVSMILLLPAYLLVYAMSFALIVLAVAMFFELIAIFIGGSQSCQNQ